MVTAGIIREGAPKKTAILLDFVQITSPSPQFGQLVQLFSEVIIHDLKVSLELRILHILYNILYIYIIINSLSSK